METNNLFRPYEKADLPALQVYVPQLMGVPGVSVREVRHGKGQAHKYCQLIRIDSEREVACIGGQAIGL